MSINEVIEALERNPAHRFVWDSDIPCPFWLTLGYHGEVQRQWVHKQQLRASALCIMDFKVQWRKQDILDRAAAA